MAKRLPVSRKALRALPLDQLVELDAFVRQLIRESRKAEGKKVAGSKSTRRREVVEERVRDNKTYRLVSVRCGKENCKCAKGPAGHGPYWYAFWSEKGATRCKYVGKKLPRGVKRDDSRE
jgi:hypothetical protein